MAIEVFNRYENKYMLDAETFDRILFGISGYMSPDAHNAGGKLYTVANIYYDTPDHGFIRRSLQKPTYKEKVRLRGYLSEHAAAPVIASAQTPALGSGHGTSVNGHGKSAPGAGGPVPAAMYPAPTSRRLSLAEDALVYVEVKKKVNGLVNKRRTAMKLPEAYAFLNGGMTGVAPYMNSQVMEEISYIIRRDRPEPAAWIAYDRMAFFANDNDDLRISFDTNIRTRRHALSLLEGDSGAPLLKDGRWLMEIKTARAMPLWLCRLLSENKVYPTSFSKYGAEFKQYVAALDAPRGYANGIGHYEAAQQIPPAKSPVLLGPAMADEAARCA
ncbi:MAG: polyphosphate polymerase domain-containing protein [Lachnospiraceae bacterium]|jgi:hypothetical protein|nr:polyphosphate polymerase domain-containing protein [Lachnospiraceae bacterium]